LKGKARGPERPADADSLPQRLARLLRQVPAGRVVTYGWLARWLGMPRGARQVGWAMHQITDADDLPWYRVVNMRGESSLRDPAGVALQRALLQDEGVEFDAEGRVDLARFGWSGPAER
jgi:methylated-DNA-protein-cysteine methyltransferase-like protein